MRWVTKTPPTAPMHCARMYRGTSPGTIAPTIASTIVTTGLRWQPEIGLTIKMRQTKIAPVAMAFASSMTAAFPLASPSAIIPEPTLVARRIIVPTASAVPRFRKDAFAGVHSETSPFLCESRNAPFRLRRSGMEAVDPEIVDLNTQPPHFFLHDGAHCLCLANGTQVEQEAMCR